MALNFNAVNFSLQLSAMD